MIQGTVAVAALVISLFALLDQSSATKNQENSNDSAAANALKSQAERVSYDEKVVAGYGYELDPFTIRNYSLSPVRDVSFHEYVTLTKTGGAPYKPVQFDLELPDIPACATGTVYLLKAIKDIVARFYQPLQADFSPEGTFSGPEGTFSGVESMTFTDTSGIRWTYEQGLGLRRASPSDGEFFVGEEEYWIPLPDYRSASTCS